MKQISHKVVQSIALATLTLWAVTSVMANTIFKCEREDGTIEFSQSPCAPPTEQVTLKAAKSGRLYEINELEPQDPELPAGAAEGETDEPAADWAPADPGATPRTNPGEAPTDPVGP